MAGADDSPPKDVSKWLTAPETLALAEASKGQLAAKVLIERLKGGVLTAVASKTSQALGAGVVTVQEKPRKIAPTLWQHRTDDSFWGSGDVHFKVGNPRAVGPSNNVWCYDIRFDPDVIAEMFTTAKPRQPEEYPGGETWASHGHGALPLVSPLAKHPGGKPPKDIWEAVWVHIAARLINGDIDPKRQKDIQDAIEDWGVANNEPISESTAKRHAKMLWRKVNPGS